LDSGDPVGVRVVSWRVSAALYRAKSSDRVRELLLWVLRNLPWPPFDWFYVTDLT